MSAATVPTIVHPSWCDQSRCSYDAEPGGVHWGTTHSLALHTDGTDPATCEVGLSLSDDDDEPLVWLDVAACGTVSLSDLERFATWLAGRAFDLRAATV